MLIPLKLGNEFKLVDEGEQVLEITKCECTPSGKPDKMKVTFKGENGGFINTQYTFSNNTSMWAMGILISHALGLKDGDQFDTKDAVKLVGHKVLGEVKHTKGTRQNDKGEFPTFANVKKIIKNVDEEVNVNDLPFDTSDISPRNAISNNFDLDL